MAEKKRVQEPGDFDIWIGGNSDATLHATFKVNR
jgi:hypothetical protein